MKEMQNMKIPFTKKSAEEEAPENETKGTNEQQGKDKTTKE